MTLSALRPHQTGVAVYTSVSDADLAAFLAGYDLGAPRSLTGIVEGIENSNFRLETQRGRLILTLFERRAKVGDLPFFVALMRHLAERGFPAPQPQPNRRGDALGVLCGKPAIIVSFLDGRPIEPPGVEACRAAAAGAARLALASEGFQGARRNDLGVEAWRQLWTGRAAAADRLRPGLAAQIDADLDALETAWPHDLPRGVIHADLFPDNLFFEGGRLSGVIDFYFACEEALAYELAVMLNAWAFSAPDRYDPALGRALLEGYESERPLSPEEEAALPILARGAAMRFFLTRLIDWEGTPEGALVTRKDPLDYAGRLAVHRAVAAGTHPPLVEPA